MAELTFNVTRDEDGNFCATAETASGALITDGRTLDELLAMVHDVVALYNEDAPEQATSFALRFNAPTIAAA